MNKIKTIEPEKKRIKETLNKKQKHISFFQRSVASKGYYESVTWSFTDQKLTIFLKKKKMK